MSNYKEFPEILAMLVFLPAGVFMGHMLNFIQTTLYALSSFHDVKYWPFVVGGVAALLTGGTHLGIKLKYKQYKYEHMYFLMVGLIILLATGVVLVSKSRELEIVSFLGFVGHGIIYVSGLSYINIRTGKSKHRYLKLSIPHALYLIGISLGATLVWTENDFRFYATPEFYWWNYTYYGGSSGALLLISSSIILGGFLINEVLQYNMSSYNYKQSLDNDINRENTNMDILKNKYFHITPAHVNLPLNTQLQQIPLEAESSEIKRCGLILYALASKVLTLMFFYYPFLYLHSVASITVLDPKIYEVFWFGTVGYIISLIFMALVSCKINYLLTITLKISFMIVMIIFFSFDLFYWYDVKVLLWFVYAGLGFGFSHSDINILSYTNLKTNEIILAIGYFIEHLIIGVLQYETLFYPENIFTISTDSNFILTHALTFILILAGLGMIGFFVIPNGKHSSLLEIKNILNNCSNINQLVNTGNYDGQQNSQSYWQQQMCLQQNYPQIAHIPLQIPSMSYDPNNSAYRPPYSQNMFHYGQPNFQQPPQQYPKYSQPQYQQGYASQLNMIPEQHNNTDLSPSYGNIENNIVFPTVTMMPQQNLSRNVAPLMNILYTHSSQYSTTNNSTKQY